MLLENRTIDEIAEYLKNTQARSDALFNSDLAFVTDWNNEELYC